MLARIEYVGDQSVVGWVIDPAQPNIPVALDVIYAGTVVDRVLANEPRPDLAATGFSTGRNGFSLRGAAALNAARLAFRPTGTDHFLPCPKAPDITGSVELVSDTSVSGWVIDRGQLDSTLLLELVIDGEIIAVTLAQVPRPDVAASFGGRGWAGFAFSFPSARPIADLRVQVAGTAISLPLELPPAIQVASAAPAGSFDGLSGSIATGWAHDPQSSGQAPVIDFFVGDRLVGSATASLYRGDVELAGVLGGRAGFRAQLAIDLARDQSCDLDARLRRTGLRLENSPKTIILPRVVGRWLSRRSRVTGRLLDRVRRRCARTSPHQHLSIILPVRNSRGVWLKESLDSALAQWCDNWELICISDATFRPHIAPILREYEARDQRIRVVTTEDTGDLAGAVKAGLEIARTEYVAFLDQGDILEPDAVFWLLQATEAAPDLIYSDEVITGEETDKLQQFCARPAFSYDYFLSYPYFTHVVCARRSVAEAVYGSDKRVPILPGPDFLLRMLEHCETVAHVAMPLYRWRMPDRGQARTTAVADPSAESLRRHLAAIGVAASVSPGEAGAYKVDFPDPGGRVLIVVPTRDRLDLLRPCLDSLVATTDPAQVRIVVVDHESSDADTVAYLHALEAAAVMPYAGRFNYSAMNNEAIGRYAQDCAFVLLLNNDVSAIEAGWLEHMRSLAARHDVGAVGATLLYPDDTVQHAGVILGLNGAADHAFKFAAFQIEGERNPGYHNSLVSVREYSAVTGACLMMRMDVFRAVGGLDETLEVGFNDIDLCLRVRDAGYRILNDPHAILYHRESATRLPGKLLDHPQDSANFVARWGEVIRLGDPFYNPMLEQNGADHHIARARHPGPVVRLARVIRPAARVPQISANPQHTEATTA